MMWTKAKVKIQQRKGGMWHWQVSVWVGRDEDVTEFSEGLCVDKSAAWTCIREVTEKVDDQYTPSGVLTW